MLSAEMTSCRSLTAALLTACLLTATLLAPTTHGAVRPSHAPASATSATPVRVAAAVAKRYWRAVPCNGYIKVLPRRPRPGGLASPSAAWVTFGSSMGPNNPAAPASSYSDCTIGLARSRWPTTSSMREDWDLLCTTVVHEMGHLLGYPHDSTRGSVMAPAFTDNSSVPAICRATRPALSSTAATVH